MDLSKLKPAKGSVQKRKRIARGEGCGSGDTAGRGHNGAKSRSGSKRKIGFEGGQMPLYRRLPKYGFKNINRKNFRGVNLDQLQSLAERKDLESVDIQVLKDNDLAGKHEFVKILGRGDLTKKLDVSAHSFSAKAQEAIEKQGGTVTKIEA